MSILIQNMDMPTDCRECPFKQYYFNCGLTKGKVTMSNLAEDYKTISFSGRADDCPIVEIDHLRKLVYLDEVKIELVKEGQKSKRYTIGEKWELNGEEIRNALDRIRIISPSSKEEEHGTD